MTCDPCDAQKCPPPDDEADYVVHPCRAGRQWCEHLQRHLPRAISEMNGPPPGARKERRERERAEAKWARGMTPSAIWALRVAVSEPSGIDSA